MSFVFPAGVLAISIDLELDPHRRLANQQRLLEQSTGQLLALLARHQLSATWAVADPAVSAATDRLVSAGGGHEVAVLGDHTWVGHEAGRSRFARELQRRVLRGRAAHLPLTTLVLRDAQLDEHVDLVVKQGITAVRGPCFGTAGRGWLPQVTMTQPHSLKFGLWEVAASQRLPGDSRLWPGGGGWLTAKQGINQTAARRGVYHVMIDALDLAHAGPAAEQVLDKLFRHAARRRQQGTLAVMTLGKLAMQLSGVRQAIPTRSILRPAA